MARNVSAGIGDTRSLRSRAMRPSRPRWRSLDRWIDKRCSLGVTLGMMPPESTDRCIERAGVMPKNITYQTDHIAAYYALNRRRWADFYPSEQSVFERVAADRGPLGRVLDVGCAA